MILSLKYFLENMIFFFIFFKYKYIDDEGDIITLSCDLELKEAFHFFQINDTILHLILLEK